MMKKATLPSETAIIPIEEAHQFLIENEMHMNKKVTNKNSELDILSQPVGLTHRERLLWLQKRRTQGLWVQCDSCNRWRYLPHIVDRYELPLEWHCKMNPDTNLADCSAPEEPIDLRDEEDLIHSRFTAGSIVWARMPGWPWWPAMVDDCPDTEQFYWLDGFTDIPNSYNVTFFDKHDVTRAWIPNGKLKPYNLNKNLGDRAMKGKKHSKRLSAAIRQAEEARKLSLSSRLAIYSFIARYKGNILSPNKVSKAAIEKYRRRLKRTFNVDFSPENSDSETEHNNIVNKTNASHGDTPKKIKPNAIKPKQLITADSTVKSPKITSKTNKLTTSMQDANPNSNESLCSNFVEENNTQSIQDRATLSSASDDFEF